MKFYPTVVSFLVLLIFFNDGICGKSEDDSLSDEDYLLKTLDKAILPLLSNPFGDFSRKREASSEEGSDESREPLAPDYKEPKDAKEEQVNKTDKPEFSVIDIPAGGFSGGFGGSFGGFGGPSIGSSLFDNDFFGLFPTISRSKPWWKGPNVCVEREEIIEGSESNEKNIEKENPTDVKSPAVLFGTINFSTCQQTPTKYECTNKVGTHGSMKTYVTKYKCCHGYKRKEGEPGCSKLDLKPMPESIKSMDGEDFLSMVKTIGMEEKLNGDNLTLFMPINNALKDYSEKLVELNNIVQAERRRREIENEKIITAKDLISSHMISGIFEMGDLMNEDVLKSNYDNSTIRINIYPMPNNELMYTANCKRIVEKDNLVTNGIVHTVDGVLQPVTNSFKDIIYQHENFKNLRKVLEKTGLLKELNESSSYTIFAPNDAAFDRVNPEFRQKLLRGDECAKNILRQHILPYTVCSNAVSVNATTRTLQGKPIRIRRDDNNQLIIDDTAIVVNPDTVTKDGLIHEIDNILIPESGLDVNEFLIKHNLTEFQRLLKEAEMDQIIDDMKNVTIFAPTNEALNEASEEIEKLKSDKKQLQDFIMYHTIKGELKSCDFNNDALLRSGIPNEKIRMNLYNTLPFFRAIFNRVTLNCAKLVDVDEQACGAVLHPISKVLTPPKSTILDIVKNNERYSTFHKLLVGTELENELRKEDGAFTVLVPDNEAFEKLGEEKLKSLLDDKEKADEFLRMHILPEVICCSGVGYNTFPFSESVKTLASHSLAPGHDSRQRVKFGDAVVTKCDQIGTNGIVHEVNRVLGIPRRYNPFGDIATLMMFYT